MGSKSKGDGNYRNPCLTMHQPWASLLVYGIKRIEGRSWPSPIRASAISVREAHCLNWLGTSRDFRFRGYCYTEGSYKSNILREIYVPHLSSTDNGSDGRLWIHAAGKVPDPDTIKAMEDYYRAIYAVNGITDLKFPEHYPISRLLGCIEVVGCVTLDELVSWEVLPEGVRLEGQTDYCWLCEQPQKLIVPFEMRGYQGVYNLEKKIHEAAVRGLSPVKPPLPVKFPIPDPRDVFSLKPGSLASNSNNPKTVEIEKTPILNAAIAGARAAATQFSSKKSSPSTIQDGDTPISARTRNKSKEAAEGPDSNVGVSNAKDVGDQ